MSSTTGAITSHTGLEQDEVDLTTFDVRPSIVYQLHSALQRSGHDRAVRVREVVVGARLEWTELVGDAVDHDRGPGIAGCVVDCVFDDVEGVTAGVTAFAGAAGGRVGRRTVIRRVAAGDE